VKAAVRLEIHDIHTHTHIEPENFGPPSLFTLTPQSGADHSPCQNASSKVNPR
jgi:hypothetical protein